MDGLIMVHGHLDQDFWCNNSMMQIEFRERVEHLLRQKEINVNSELGDLFRLSIQDLNKNEKYQ